MRRTFRASLHLSGRHRGKWARVVKNIVKNCEEKPIRRGLEPRLSLFATLLLRLLLRRCLRPIIGGILMAVVSLAIIHFAGSGIVGLGAAAAAASLVYVPLILPMRHLIRQSPGEPAEVIAARAA